MKSTKKSAKVNDTNRDIFQYVWKNWHGKRQKVGVLYASRYGSYPNICIGWSKVALTKGDKFNLTKGLKIAKGRTKASLMVIPPHSFYKDLYKFAARCDKYFKGCHIITNCKTKV